MSAPEAATPLDGTAAPADPAVDSGVKASLTPRQLERIVKRQAAKIEKLEAALANRPAKRPRREVETLDYIKAAERFIRSAGERVGESDEFELAELVAMRNTLEAAITVAVHGQRNYGKSWADIGRAVGTTREAAWQRWGRDSTPNLSGVKGPDQ